MDEQHDIIRGWKDFLSFLEADAHAHNVAKWRPWMKYQHPELHYQRVLRVVELLSTYRGLLARFAWMIARVRLSRLSAFYGISIPPGVFGRGLSVAHLGSIVVNNNARIGRNCRIHTGSNIGVLRGNAPTLGNGVYIGPGAVIAGGISIGSGAVIGANSVVTKDVPSRVVVAGAPAKFIREVRNDSPMPPWMREVRETGSERDF